MSSPAPRPLLVQISDVASGGEAGLFARLAALEGAPPAARARAVVMLREPTLSGRDLLALARALRARTRALGVGLWVNDRLDVAALVAADGAHLAGRSVGVDDARRLLGAGATISVACHTPDEVLAARTAGADAATLSPIFASPQKGAPIGLDALRSARLALGPAPGFSLVALGGIDEGVVLPCLAAGADGVAAIRADLLACATRAPG